MGHNGPMGRLLRAAFGWITRHLLLFGLIVALLVSVPLLVGQWHGLADAGQRLESLARNAAAIAQAGAALRQQLDAQIPQSQQPADWQQFAAALDQRIAARKQARDQLQQQYPLQSRVLTSEAYRQLKTLELEIRLLEQGRAYAASVLTVLGGLVAGEQAAQAQLSLCLRHVAAAEARLYDNRRAQWQLSRDFPLAWQVPGLATYQQMKALEAQQRELTEAAREAHQRCDTLTLVMNEKARVAAYIAPFDPASSPADQALRELGDEQARLQAYAQGHWLRQAVDTAQQVLPVALWVLAGIIVTPIAIKLVFYFVLAPLAARRPPLCLLPGSGGGVRVPPGGRVSAVSQSIVLGPGEEMLVHPQYLQSAALGAPKSTRWLLSWAMPFTSLASGLFALTRVLPHEAEPVVVSSTRDPLSEVGLIELPADSALALQPRNLIGLVQRQAGPPRITRHWRLGHLHSWFTLQLRYVVFHGPAILLVKGCRGVRVEAPQAGRAINQALTMGFSANLRYATTRCETFAAYWMGQQELFNDRFAQPQDGGSGFYVYEEMIHPQRKTGVTGRGLEGLTDALLKAFGV